MINLFKAYLHIIGEGSGSLIFSDYELDLEEDVHYNYILKTLEKLCRNANLQRGEFKDTSVMMQNLDSYRRGKTEFREVTMFAANKLFDAMCEDEAPSEKNLFSADFELDGNRVVAFWVCENKVANLQEIRTNDEGKLRTHIASTNSVLPAPGSKPDMLALIGLDELTVRLQDKKRKLDGAEVYVMSERILKCEANPAPKAVMDTVKNIAQNVALNHGEQDLETVARTKNSMLKVLDESPFFEPEELAETVFAESPILQEEYKEKIREAGVPKQVNVPKAVVTKSARSQKIKTDTGIEVTFPLEFFDNSDYIEFTTLEDGTINIRLKNISTIESK